MAKKTINYQIDQKSNVFNVPTTLYQSKQDIEDEQLHPILVQLLEKAIQESKDGKLIPHDEVMKMARERYPFLNGL